MKKVFTILLFLISLIVRGDVSPHFSLLDSNNCKYKKDYVFLSNSKKKAIESRLNFHLNSLTVRRLKVECPTSKSFAYILNDKVRTHYQTLLIWISDQKLQGLEVLEFHEPKQYQAPSKWIEHTVGVKRKNLYQVDALSGATLTRQSTINLIKQAFELESL